MRLCALAVVATVAACSSDPTLAVAVTHPTGLSVAKTTVTVYESETLHCGDVEFARIDDVTLEALAVSEADINATAHGDLDGISRTNNKVVVARGYDPTGALVSAGCTEKGEVVGSDSVAVTTVIAAVVALQRPDTTSNEIEVSLTNGTGEPLPDARAVTWTVYGPAGSTAANPANTTSPTDGVWEPTTPSCASGGLVTLHPNPPKTLGGYAVQIRVSWAVQQPSRYTSLAADSFGVIAMANLATTLPHYCAIRIKDTTHRLVCLSTAPDPGKAYDFELGVSATGKVTATLMNTVSVGTDQVAVVSVPVAGGTDRDVYSVSIRGVLTGLFAPSIAVTDTTPVVATGVRDAIAVPPCGATRAKILMVSTTVSDTIRQIDVGGGNEHDGATYGRADLDNAGCVTQLQTSGNPTLVQLASIQTTATSDVVLLACDAGPCKPLPNITLTRSAGIGFTGGAEPRIVAPSVDATGVILLELVFTATNGTVERNRMPAASVPDRIVAGQVDKDTAPDLFWNIPIRATTTSFEIAYGRTIGTDNLEALSGTQTLAVNSLAMGDLTGDGVDDVLVLSSTGVAIVPNGVTLTPPAANDDLTCSP